MRRKKHHAAPPGECGIIMFQSIEDDKFREVLRRQRGEVRKFCQQACQTAVDSAHHPAALQPVYQRRSDVSLHSPLAGPFRVVGAGRR